MSAKKYVVIPFDDAEHAALFITEVSKRVTAIGPTARILDADEYPTKRYNGWTNYETWAVKLWADNGESSYRCWGEAAQEAYNEATPGEYEWQTRDQQAIYALSKRLQDDYEALAEELTGEAGVFSDLISAALSKVNWSEIAKSLLEDVDKTQDEKEEAVETNP